MTLEVAIYLLGALGAIILGTYAYWFKRADERLDDHSTRLAGIEAVLPKMDRQLDRIEDKLNGR